MLSYRHAFHAGNFADVLKHIVLCECLQHFVKKDKAFIYIDTHAGAGLYALHTEEADKLGEYRDGIGKLQSNNWPELAAYFNALQSYNADDQLAFYPGSPALALKYLRPQDQAWLYELHPQDFSALKKFTDKYRQVFVHNRDGLEGLLAVVPPKSRRGLILIDPSYEVKTDYHQVIDSLVKAYRKFTTGTYLVWYPVVERQNIRRMENALIAAAIPDVQQFELGIQADTHGRGMTAAGLFVINPPWKLFEKMGILLPKLAKAFSKGKESVYKCEILAREKAD